MRRSKFYSNVEQYSTPITGSFQASDSLSTFTPARINSHSVSNIKDLDFPKFLPINKKRTFFQNIESNSNSRNKHLNNYNHAEKTTFKPITIHLISGNTPLFGNFRGEPIIPEDLFLPDLASVDKLV